MGVETHCDECGRGICGEETICRRCYEDLENRIEQLESDLDDAKSTIQHLEEQMNSEKVPGSQLTVEP